MVKAILNKNKTSDFSKKVRRKDQKYKDIINGLLDPRKNEFDNNSIIGDNE